ncbi:MAG: heavy-metal-associated domain-containing protein [Rhizobiales bacterium]|nr:heavy-metal-associated domain-containing protein [Hyphomicrobiales bacterium]
MKKIRIYIVAFIFAITTILPVISVSAEIIEIEFKIVNMRGYTDEYKIRKILSDIKGVQRAIIEDGAGKVLLTFDDQITSLFDIKTALASQGYPATKIAVLSSLTLFQKYLSL